MALAFGTSGLRGLAAELTDEVCIRFTRAFVGHFKTLNSEGVSGRALLRKIFAKVLPECKARAVEINRLAKDWINHLDASRETV